MHAVALHHDLAQPLVPVGQLLGNEEPAFDPILFLGEAHRFHVLDIIGMVVDQRHGALLIKTLHQHALGVEIRESQRSHDRIHAGAAAHFDHFVHQGLGYLAVVHEVEPAETDLLVIPLGVCLAVDDAGDAADGLAVPVGHVQFRLAELHRRILGGIQGPHLVEYEGGDIIWIVPVEFFREKDKFANFLSALDASNFECHIGGFKV